MWIIINIYARMSGDMVAFAKNVGRKKPHGAAQTADKPIWHASIQPSPTEGKGDREHADAVAGEAVEEVVEVLDFTKFFELNCVGIGSLPPSPP